MGAAQTSTASNSTKLSILWFDASVNNTEQNMNAQRLLRASFHHLKIFKNENKCKNYIRSLSKENRVILIVNGRLGRHITPRIHELEQVSSIYVYCMNKRLEEWTKQFSKVKYVTEDLNQLVTFILSTEKSTQKRRINHDRLKEAFSINIFHANNNRDQSISELNDRFIQSQVLIDCLLKMKSFSKDKIDFISLCKKDHFGNESKLNMINDFEKNYSSNQAISWYTRDSFLYRLFNNVLQVQNIDLLYLSGFFIRDLHYQLEQNRYPTRITIYRGQLMSNEELKKLKNSKVQLISINSFVSTSSNRDIALSLITAVETSTTGLQPVLFEIDADPCLKGTRPFCNISSFNHMSDDEEILMMLGSIFRINHIYLDNRVWIIKMSLCSDYDHDVKTLFDYIKHVYYQDGKIDACTFGIVLAKIGKLDQANRYFHRLLNEIPPNDPNFDICTQNLSQIALQKNVYDSSSMLLHRSRDNTMNLLNPDQSSFANSLINTGNIYLSQNENQRALELFDEALAIHERIFNEKGMISCLTNMGHIYIKEKEPQKALDCYKKLLIIEQKLLPTNHYDLGAIYNNIALAYRMLRQYDNALEHFQLALKIYETSLPSLHDSVGTTYHGIGAVYTEKGNFPRALFYFEKAAIIFRQTLPHDHDNIREVERNIQDIRKVFKESQC